MRVGDYVRTDDGLIRKIEKIERNAITIDISLNDYSSNLINRKYLKEIIIKSSPNIIDLIEVGDYVNGCRVKNVYSPDGKSVFRIELEVDGLKGHIISKSENITSIVTKEQFEAIKYEIK